MEIPGRDGEPLAFRFHDLRHTTATSLLRRGTNPKLVQALLGHSTVAITLDTYSHVLPDMLDGVSDTLAIVMAPQPGLADHVIANR